MKINLASTKLAFYLMALLVIQIILSAVVPQRGIAEHQILDWRAVLGDGYVAIEKLGLDRIYTSPLFIATVIALGVSLVASNVRRIGRLRRVHSTRTRMRLAGSIVFHFALLLVVAGSALNHMYRYRVVFGLTEGQTVTSAPGGYFRDLSGPLCRTSGDFFAIGVNLVHAELQIGDATAEAAEISVAGLPNTPPVEGLVRVNKPLRRDGIEFHLGARMGYSPEIAVTDKEGNKVFRSFVRLAQTSERGKTVNSDFVILPGDSTRIALTVTDGDGPDRQARTRVTVERNGEQIYNGFPGTGGSGLPDGSEIAVPRLRRWCYIEAIRNPFMSVVFAGFWIALAGLVITLAPRLKPARSSVS